MRLLRDAGRLDLLADGGACRERPTRRAASGVAAAVAACSLPRKSGGLRAPQGNGEYGERPGPSVQRVGLPAASRRPHSSAAQLEDFIKKARFGTGVEDSDVEDVV
ncbi:hypothetical protein NDU88_006882 [Pleurodeles waltl]|uniref:Uncharacterized protein n=1 Tax=Pleurodeles waltl TaxID=8319 RepID=A0AAV7QMF2_PLEWA|nr:hypothetical protein NDU88_006882 [Pleurodeles waltl]